MKVAVLGAGSWGTAIAQLLAQRHAVQLWSFEEAVARQIRNGRENRTYLPGITLPESLEATADLAKALEDARVVVSVVPSQHTRTVLTDAAPHIPSGATLVCASKGIEIGSLMRMDQVFADVLGPEREDHFTVLSGPSFAKEVAAGAPTAVVVAGRSEERRHTVQHTFQTERFRVYTNDDVVGVELGGALKNVIAVAAGLAAGLGHGHNTRAALITRGLAEMARLGVRMGARRSTFAGLAGMGDLVLTCTGELSRNRTVGFRLGQGETLDSILSDMNAVAEGIKTTEAAAALAEQYDVEMPICAEIHAIVSEGRHPLDVVKNLMQRDPKPEEWE